MRKDAKTAKANANITSCEMYHGTLIEGELQANSFEGGAKYYASDRAKPLHSIEFAKGYAIEWEMTSLLTRDSNILATILDAEFSRHFPENFYKYERDCTVDIECVSQVGTKAFWRNKYADVKEIYKYLKTIQTYPNANAQSCGMHVNISVANFGKDEATQRTNIMKLHNWINKDDAHYRFACAMVHRDINHNDWAQRVRPDELSPSGDHARCMNYSHMNEGRAARVEIRLVGAQKTYGAWRNTMETVFWLVKQSKELSAKDWENPVKLWSGCNQYVFDRLQDNFRDIEKLEIIHANVKREELI